MAGLISVSPSPSKDQDVFGKELRLSEAERKILSSAGEIFLSKTVHVDSHSKKGDSTEPRTLVVSSSRCYILVQNPSTKLETSFNFLRIQELQCSDTKLTFHMVGEPRPRELLSSRQDSVEIISLITAQLRNVFPKTPLDLFLKLTFDPDSLRNDVSRLRDELTNMMERVDASTIQGFLTAYGFLCNFFSVDYNMEVSWYLKNVYLAHGSREMKLSDFDHLSPKDFLPVISSLRHNHFFEGIVDRDGKLGPPIIEEFCHVLNSSPSIKTLVLSNCGLKPDNIVHLSNSLKNNPRASLTHLNLSDNPLDDKAIEALGSALEALPHGLQQLRLANCKISVKGASALANNMKQNKHMQFSLVHLDLSSNPLGPDPLGALSFIQETQTISTLNLSNCNLLLEHVVPLLNRGCTQHLCDLNLSNNTGKGKKVVHPTSVASGFQQFCSSSISIRSLSLSNCKLNTILVKSILEGLAVNPNVTSVKLDISSNDLGGAGAQQMLDVVGRVSCLHQLNLSECNLDQNMPHIIAAVTHNKNIAHLMLGRNFSGKAAVRVPAVQQLAAMLASEDCQLVSLCVEDSHLKEHTSLILETLVDNNSLAKINLSGNHMGARGARSLARALLSNCSLTEISWDHNDTPLRGFQEVAVAMKQNYTLRVMPLPLGDIGRAGKGVEEHVQSMQQYLCRNHSDERLKVEIAARHRTRLLTASQQSSAVGRELVQLEDLLQWLQSHDPSHQLVAEGSKVKELANKAIELTDGLYSPQVESEQFQAIAQQIKGLLDQFMEDLFVEHIKTRSEKMVKKSISICDTLLSEETCQNLQELVVENKGAEFTQAKKDVLRHALPEIVNHVSDSNVEVAANISELVVEHTLRSLEKTNHKMFKLQKEIQAKNQQATDAKVSRNFTFRVQEDNSPTKKKKKRVRRPDPEDDDDIVDLPTVPLETEGPTLEHLGKSRPKPARMQRGRPSKKPSSQPEAVDSTPALTDPAPLASDTNVESPQPKVAMKPPPPHVAEKKIKQMLEMKNKDVTDKEVVEEKKEAPVEAKEDCGAVEEVVSEKEEVVLEKEEVEDEEEEERDASKVSSDERCTSEEPEEHRTVIQQGTPLQGGTSNEELDKEVTSPSTSPLSSDEKKEDSHSVSPVTLEDVKEDAKQDEALKKEEQATSSDHGEVEPNTPTQQEKPDGSSIKSKGSKKRFGFSKLVSTSKDAGDGADSASNDGDGRSSSNSNQRESASMAEWEVIEAAKASPSPEVVKKPPPAVREKPRKPAATGVEDHEEVKKVPILPSAQIIQGLKATKSEGDAPPPSGKLQASPPPAVKLQPSPPPKTKVQPSPPPAAKPQTSDSPRPTKSTPSPAPKPRPKPSLRKKAEADKPETTSTDAKGDSSLDTMV